MNEPQFTFEETDWILIKRGLGKLPLEESINLVDRMRAHEYAVQEFEKKQTQNEKPDTKPNA